MEKERKVKSLMPFKMLKRFKTNGEAELETLGLNNNRMGFKHPEFPKFDKK